MKTNKAEEKKVNPPTHFTLHENGQWSLIHQGQPMTAPQEMKHTLAYVRRMFPQALELPVWSAKAGNFSPMMQSTSLL